MPAQTRGAVRRRATAAGSASESEADYSTSEIPDPKSIPVSVDSVLTENFNASRPKDVSSRSSGRGISLLDVLRTIFGIIALSTMMSYFIVGDSYVWGQEKVVRKYWRGLQRSWVCISQVCEITKGVKSVLTC